MSLRVEVEPAVALLVLHGEPVSEGGVSGFEFGAGVIALDLLTHALQDSSGVTEELPHVGPHLLFEPRCVHVVRMPAWGAVNAPGVLLVASVVGVPLAARRRGSPGTATAARRAGDEPREKIVAGLLPAREAPVLFEARERLPLQLGLDDGRDSLLYDLTGRECDLMRARVSGVPDNDSDCRWNPQFGRWALLAGVLPARREHTKIVQAPASL